MRVFEKLLEAHRTGEVVVLTLDRGPRPHPVGVVTKINHQRVVIDEFGTEVAYFIRFIEDVKIAEESAVDPE